MSAATSCRTCGPPGSPCARSPATRTSPASRPASNPVKGDLTDPHGADLAAALDGVTAAHLITFAGTADDPYAQLADGDGVVAALQRAGVERVTVLSGGESPLETAVKASDLEWTILQPVEFMSGALDWAASIRDEGVVRTGFADRRSAMVDEYDIGAVAAGVLTRGGYGRRELPISGPEVLTPADMVRIVGDAIGRDITLIPLTEDEAREQWRKEGFPDDVIDFFVWAHGNTPEVGYTVAPTVPDVTGRPARTLGAVGGRQRGPVPLTARTARIDRRGLNRTVLHRQLLVERAVRPAHRRRHPPRRDAGTGAELAVRRPVVADRRVRPRRPHRTAAPTTGSSAARSCAPPST